MKPMEFLKTVYLGDRCCTGISWDPRTKEIRLFINKISRVRDPSGNWEYYTDEDIDDRITRMRSFEKSRIRINFGT